jgi:drug/metabolite transporter (DMT)-like permease
METECTACLQAAEPWFYFILAALVCYGGIDFLQKAAARADSSPSLVVRISAAVVAGFSLLAVLITGEAARAFSDIVLFAAINSTFFALGSMARITALKKLPAAYVFPVAKLNSVLLIIIAVIFFGDRPDLSQWTGIVLSVFLVVGVGYNFSRDQSETDASGREQFPKEGRAGGFLLALAAASCITVSVLTGKFASTRVPLFSYMFVSYSLVVLYTFVLARVRASSHCPAEEDKPGRRRTHLYGAGIGVLNFAGYFLILKALSSGPLALIQGISSTSFVIPILLAAVFFKERLTLRRSLVVVCAVVSVILQHGVF